MNPITCLRERPDLLDRAAAWFAERWDVPAEAYRASMTACAEHPGDVPQWYAVLDDDGAIVAGCGIIENDFHDRPDLAPNLCALYVEPARRGEGIARRLLDFARRDMGARGCDRLYLVTDHERLYERCGWEFLCMATDNEGAPIRLYGAGCPKS